MHFSYYFFINPSFVWTVGLIRITPGLVVAFLTLPPIPIHGWRIALSSCIMYDILLHGILNNLNIVLSKDAIFSVYEILALICPQSIVSVIIVIMEASRSNKSKAPKGVDHAQSMLRCVACKMCLSSVASLTTVFQTASGSSISTKLC